MSQVSFFFLIQANTPVDKWFKDRGFPNAAAEKLQQHDVITIQDLQDMSYADMVEAGLSVGERNNIKRALREISTSMV